MDKDHSVALQVGAIRRRLALQREGFCGSQTPLRFDRGGILHIVLSEIHLRQLGFIKPVQFQLLVVTVKVLQDEATKADVSELRSAAIRNGYLGNIE